MSRVDEPWTLGLDPSASHTLLDGKHRVQQLPRSQFSLEFHGTVEKPRLIGKFNWLGFVKRRNTFYLSQGVELGDSLAQIGFAIPDVRAE